MYTKLNQKISVHFNSSEFKCKCGCNTVKVDDSLINMLEKIMNVLNSNYCIINSGYRCPSYDKKIGGFVGKHSQGIACDCKFYDKNMKIIPSWKVLCVCQDLYTQGGFAKINNNSVHIDARQGTIYRGDETISNNTVTTDFYKYFNKTKTDVYGSSYQDTTKIDLSKVVDDVIKGKYGNGSIRKQKLQELGFDYKVIQTMVNERLRGGK